MSAKLNWPKLFDEFFKDPEYRKQLGVIGTTNGVRELWLQGALFYWLNDVKRIFGEQQEQENPWYYLEANETIFKKLDLVCGQYHDGSWIEPLEMVAELKFLGYSYQTKNIYGCSLNAFPGINDEGPIVITAEHPLLNSPKKNSLLYDYKCLIGMPKEVAKKRYLILVYSRYIDEKKPRKTEKQMRRVLDNMVFGNEILSEDINLVVKRLRTSKNRCFRVKIWEIV